MTQSSFVVDDDSWAIPRAVSNLRAHRQCDSFWLFELEADVTITAEYVLLEHHMGRVSPDLQRQLAVHIRRKRSAGGGWPIIAGGAFDLSASVKAYYALKLVGDDTDEPHMREARAAILAGGGAERGNVFTRIQLALFGAVPWRAVPMMPVEIVVLPARFTFSIWAVSYWSRTCIVPLMVIQALRPRARNPLGLGVDELFATPPEAVRDWLGAADRTRWAALFRVLDGSLRRLEPLHFARSHPRWLRAASLHRAVRFVDERLNGSDGLGAIYPAMAYAAMMYDALGDEAKVATAWSAIDGLIRREAREAFCQPCLSPVWDTALAAHALAGSGEDVSAEVAAACAWLAARQVNAVRGDWSRKRPRLEPGGWAFQFRNDHYPDVDDTAVVGMLLQRHGASEHRDAVERARRWIVGMQGRSGGWGAFEANSDRTILNHIPFADHGALLDEPTADVTARCVSFLASLSICEDERVIARAVAFLLREQRADGSWFGRWGCNHIYGTWSVLSALSATDGHDEAIDRGAQWLLSVQHADGGWGEDESSYDSDRYVAASAAQPSQTAWAMLGLMAALRPIPPWRRERPSCAERSPLTAAGSTSATPSAFPAFSTSSIAATARTSRFSRWVAWGPPEQDARRSARGFDVGRTSFGRGRRSRPRVACDLAELPPLSRETSASGSPMLRRPWPPACAAGCSASSSAWRTSALRPDSRLGSSACGPRLRSASSPLWPNSCPTSEPSSASCPRFSSRSRWAPMRRLGRSPPLPRSTSSSLTCWRHWCSAGQFRSHPRCCLWASRPPRPCSASLASSSQRR